MGNLVACLSIAFALASAAPVTAQPQETEAAAAAAQEAPKPAGNDAAELAKKLANPIGALISVPFQNNMDVGIGELNGSRNTLNFQPIVPFRLNENYSLITRYILPVITAARHHRCGEPTERAG